MKSWEKEKKKKIPTSCCRSRCTRCSHTSQSLSLCHPEARFWPKDPYTLYSLKNVPGNFSLYSQPLRIIEAGAVLGCLLPCRCRRRGLRHAARAFARGGVEAHSPVA